MQKQAEITLNCVRDELGVLVSNAQTTCMGSTEDDGVNVTLGLGNLVGIENALPGDIFIAVSTINILEPAYVGISLDPDNGLQTITFDID